MRVSMCIGVSVSVCISVFILYRKLTHIVKPFHEPSTESAEFESRIKELQDEAAAADLEHMKIIVKAHILKSFDLLALSSILRVGLVGS